jgi:NAD(P)-dependent dehydrogenase (short-subunit alcohol dehydrogenase family)
MGRLADRVALVTGAGFGIGRGIARRFAREGCAVVIAEIDPMSGARTAAEVDALGGQGLYVPADVSDTAACRRAVEATIGRFGRVDVLVNNAWGGGSMVRLEHSTEEQMEHGLRMAFWAAYWSMQRCFPVMRDAGGGSIINICSLNGVNAHIGTADYNTAKEALRTLTRSAAREWAPTGVVANVICPGALTASARAVFAEHPELEAQAKASIPMGRLGDPERDIAPVAVFLASEDCRWMTGNTLFVGGGTHINGSAWAPELPEDA